MPQPIGASEGRVRGSGTKVADRFIMEKSPNGGGTYSLSYMTCKGRVHSRGYRRGRKQSSCRSWMSN